MKRFFIFLTVTVLLISCVTCAASAASYSTYADILGTNSTVQSLLSLRNGEELYSDYVCIRASNYEYYLFFSDTFSESDGTVRAGDYTGYCYNTTNTQNNATRYSTVSGSSLTIDVNHVVVSNFMGFSSRADEDSSNLSILKVIGILLFALVLFLVIRRFR